MAETVTTVAAATVAAEVTPTKTVVTPVVKQHVAEAAPRKYALKLKGVQLMKAINTGLVIEVLEVQ